MKAIMLREFGGPDVLRYEDVPDPKPAPFEALIRVHAVTVNRSFDVGVRQNGNERDVTLPLVMGIDPAGVVVEVGPDVQGLQVGDHVTPQGGIPRGSRGRYHLAQRAATVQPAAFRAGWRSHDRGGRNHLPPRSSGRPHHSGDWSNSPSC